MPAQVYVVVALYTLSTLAYAIWIKSRTGGKGAKADEG